MLTQAHNAHTLFFSFLFPQQESKPCNPKHSPKRETYQRGDTTATYRGAVLLHGMAEFVSLDHTTGEEAVLAHVKVEAFQAAVPDNRNGKDG